MAVSLRTRRKEDWTLKKDLLEGAAEYERAHGRIIDLLPKKNAELMGCVIEGMMTGSQRLIYRARRLDGEGVRALSVIMPHLIEEPDVVGAFAREAEVLSSVRGENIPRLYSQGSIGGVVPFLEMDFISGRTLARVVRTHAVRRLDLQWLARAGDGLCATLSLVHKGGFIHRDVTPMNVLVDSAGLSSRLVLIGYAFAEKIGEVTEREERAIGTLGFLAPEQANLQAVDVRTDVFGLGATLHRAAYGKTPYGLGTEAELFQAAKQGRIILPEGRSRFGAAGRFWSAIHKATRPSSADRHQSIEEFAAELRSVGTPRN